MVNYPNNPTVGQRFTLPSGVIMECVEADATPIWQAVPAADAIPSEPPASSTSTGQVGKITWDSDYIYVCIATNTWKRSRLSTW